MKLYIKNREFYDQSDNPVKPEIGNADQIEVLKRYSQISEKGFSIKKISTFAQMKIFFGCICEKELNVTASVNISEIDDFGSMDINTQLINLEKPVKCSRCGCKYIFDETNEGTFIKLLPEKQ